MFGLLKRITAATRDDKPAFGADELRVFSLLAKCGFSPETIFDIGAANGEWSALLHAVFPRASFHLFEPLADVLPSYQQNLRAQLDRNPQFSLHPIALGGETGTATIRIHADGVSSTILNI